MQTFQAALAWLTHDDNENIALSALVILVGLVAYVAARRRAVGFEKGSEEGRLRTKVLAFGIVILQVLILLHIWIAPEALGDDESARSILVENLLWTCTAAVGVYVLVVAIQRTMLRRAELLETRYRIRQISSWAGAFFFLVIAALIWNRQLGNFAIYLSVIGAGLALSMQETLLCIAGWALIMVKRPFDIGDRVEVNSRIGDVIDVALFQTSMLEVGNWVKADQSTGRMLIVPNSAFFRNEIYNYTKGFPFIWNEFSTVVTFESDWKAAKEIMQRQADEEADKLESEVRRQIRVMQRQYVIHYDHLRPIVYTSIAAHGVELTLRYLSPVRQRRHTAHRISESILEAFIAHPTTDFAYPTTRMFRNNYEGKPDLGGPKEPS